MQYSRRELLDLLLDFVGENNDPNARNTAERLINIALMTIWSKMAWRQFEMPQPYTFATVAGTPTYGLPAYFGRVKNGIVRNITTGARVYPVTLTDLQSRIPEANTALDITGPPQVYAIAGTQAVDAQVVSAGEAVTAVSDDAADINVKVTIAGLDSNRRYRRLQAQLNGNIAVPVGTWTNVMEMSKAIPSGTDPTTELTSSRGNVTVTGATTGVLVVLSAQESAIERMQLTLWPTPNTSNVIAVPMLRAPSRLVYDSDLTPWGWGPALLEEMNILWNINSGEMQSAPAYAGPALQDLMALENSNRFGVPSRVRAFGG